MPVRRDGAHSSTVFLIINPVEQRRSLLSGIFPQDVPHRLEQALTPAPLVLRHGENVATALSLTSAKSGLLTLNVRGSGFVKGTPGGSKVRWNGSERSTTFISNTQLTAALTAVDIAQSGTAIVNVFNAAPEGGTSNGLTLAIPAGPFVSISGIADAASFSGPALAPGTIASLFGTGMATTTATATEVPLPVSLGGVTVRLNGIAAPLYFVSAGQINFMIPWDLANQQQVSVTVSTPLGSGSVSAVTSSYSPAIFSMNQQGNGQGVVLIANTATVAAKAGSLAGYDCLPAARGEFLTIYAIGLGPVTNTPASGSPALGSPISSSITAPTATIGGVQATVSFSGLTPGFVGLYQVNVQVPDNAPSGNAVPVAIKVGGVASNTVTIAIQ